MRITHKVDLESGRVTIDQIRDAQEKFLIPGGADVFECSEEYTVIIEWQDGE